MPVQTELGDRFVRGREHVAERIFKKWDLDVATIGVTTDTKRLVLKHQGETVCDLPLDPIGEEAPKYDRPSYPPEARAAIDLDRIKAPAHLGETLLTLMGSPDMASKRWIWSQYDRHVMADTIASSEDPADAAIVRIHGTNKALAITTDCTPRYCAVDPFEGGKQAVAEAWRNLTAVGADPIAITDCLNFGNPERPEIMGQFVGCVEGPPGYPKSGDKGRNRRTFLPINAGHRHFLRCSTAARTTCPFSPQPERVEAALYMSFAQHQAPGGAARPLGRLIIYERLL